MTCLSFLSFMSFCSLTCCHHPRGPGQRPFSHQVQQASCPCTCLWRCSAHMFYFLTQTPKKKVIQSLQGVNKKQRAQRNHQNMQYFKGLASIKTLILFLIFWNKIRYQVVLKHSKLPLQFKKIIHWNWDTKKLHIL